jgi:hypothetical protein
MGKKWVVGSALAFALLFPGAAAWAQYTGPSPSPAVSPTQATRQKPVVLPKHLRREEGFAVTGADVVGLTVVGLGALGIGVGVRQASRRRTS